MAEQECIFCNIAQGKVPSKKVYEDDKVVAVLDINPAAPGHVLVIPKAHMAVMPQMDDELVRHLGVVAKTLSHELIMKLGSEGVSVFIANGGAAGQRAPHFMMHIIPRKEGDGIQLDPPTSKIPDDQMDQVFLQMKPSVDKHFRGIRPEKNSTPGDEGASSKADGSAQIGNPELDDITNLLAGK